MKKKPTPTKCYISAYQIPNLDPFLKDHGFCGGMILFSIPDFGIQFRCRADGDIIDLEFAAFFGLLKFLTKNLSEQKIDSVQLFSSNPEFVFAFAGNSKHLKPGTQRFRLVQDYHSKIKIAVGYLEPKNNKALVSAADFPQVPNPKSIKLKLGKNELNKSGFKPFQKGLQL